MKPCVANRRDRAITWVDVVVVVAVLVILAAFILLPLVAGAKRRAQGINCASNLKQTGLTYRIWQGDHNGQYPFSVSVTNGGGMELIATGKVAAFWLTMTDYLGTPRIFTCPADTRDEARFFTPVIGYPDGFNNSNISYFVGLNANEGRPQTFLFGDDNFAIGDGIHPHPTDNSAVGDIPVKSGLLEISSNAPIWWTEARHKFIGNVAFADGSVRQVSGDELDQALQAAGLATNRLVIP